MKSVHPGFTLFETLLAMTIISVISVASIYMLYLSLRLRDLSLASAKTEESLRIFDRTLRNAAMNSRSVTGGGMSLFFTGTDTCWSFVYNSAVRNIKYAKISQSGCTPNQNPVINFFPQTVSINNANFFVTPLDTGGRQVGVTGTITTTLPFDTYQNNFSSTYINLID